MNIFHKLSSALHASTFLLACLVCSGCASTGKHYSEVDPNADVGPASGQTANAHADADAKDVFSGEPGDGHFPVIDAHTHNHFTNQPEPTSHIVDNLQNYLKEMKAAGVVGAVVHTGAHQEGYQNLDQYNVLHCAGTGAEVNVPAIEAGLKSGIYRCIKIYLGYVHQWAYDKKYEPAYALALKYHVPVVFHTGDTYSVKGKLKYSDPLTIDEVAVDHPNVTFVIAHCGNPWIESAAEVAYKNPNVYLDGSAFLIGDISKLPDAEVEEYVVKPLAWIFGYVDDPSKLMYGTDWPLANMKPYLAAFKRAIPRKYWSKVFYENAAHVFGFPEPGKMRQWTLPAEKQVNE